MGNNLNTTNFVVTVLFAFLCDLYQGMIRKNQFNMLCNVNEAVLGNNKKV